MPANAGIYYNVLMQVAAFEFFDTDDFYFKLLLGRESDAISNNFSVIGFDSAWFINNMGSLGVLIVLSPLIYLMSPLTECCAARSSLIKARRRLQRMLFWSFPIRSITEAFIIIAICSLINYRIVNFKTTWD